MGRAGQAKDPEMGALIGRAIVGGTPDVGFRQKSPQSGKALIGGRKPEHSTGGVTWNQ